MIGGIENKFEEDFKENNVNLYTEYLLDAKQYDENELRNIHYSFILTSPYNLLRENKTLFISLFVFIVLLLIIIIILLRYNRIRRLRFRDQEEYLKKIEKINRDIEIAKEKAHQANRLKTAFLANISHEIRTPLNAIIGFSSLITDQKSISQENYEKYHKLLKINSNLLLYIINDIIDLSKIETNQLNLNYQDFDLHELMDSMYEYAMEERDKADKSSIEIRMDKGARKSSFFIRSDDSRLRQVLMNLIHNAIKFTYSGGINIGYRINGGFILFYVEDTGIGLSNYGYDYIFESFRQGEEGTTKKYGGAGLGLTLAKGIVENLNGEIWAESNQDRGSIFKFQIPLIPSARNKAEKTGAVGNELEEMYNWEGKKILVVEDSNMAYELITKLLRGTGAEFTLEVDGYKAVERCSNDESIDIVLMDIQLPFLDGYEATRQIKKIRPNLPVIAQTANAMLEDKRKAWEVGCEDYIAKPLDRIELAEKINNLLFRLKK